jgi:hypothetical protein
VIWCLFDHARHIGEARIVKDKSGGQQLYATRRRAARRRRREPEHGALDGTAGGRAGVFAVIGAWLQRRRGAVP